MARAPAALLLLSLLLASSCTANTLGKPANAQYIGDQLKRYGPSQPDSPERLGILMDIDTLFLNDTHEPLKAVVRDLISTTLWEISSSSQGAPTVWYFWNMGYLLRAGGAILGFDLANLELSPLDEEQKRILGQSLDILFVSHVDGPHVDRDIVTYMREDAYVVCPEEVVSFFELVADRKATIIGMKKGESRTVGPADVEAYEGDDRRGTPMRCFLVTIDGTRALQTGDQHYVADWMKELSSRRVSVLMIGPLEQYDWVVEATNTIKPSQTIPGGLYDMSHPKDTWSGFPYAYRIKEDSAESHVLPMFFGESVQLKSETKADMPVIVISAVALIGGVVLLAKARPRKAKRRQRGGPRRELRCEKRYVEKLCLTCRYYVIRGGQPFCSRYNFALDSGDR